MIEVMAPVQQDKIIELIDGLAKEGVTFSYKEKKGMKIYFETTAEDVASAAKMLKAEVKAQPWGSVLYFQVAAV